MMHKYPQPNEKQIDKTITRDEKRINKTQIMRGGKKTQSTQQFKRTGKYENVMILVSIEIMYLTDEPKDTSVTVYLCHLSWCKSLYTVS